MAYLKAKKAPTTRPGMAMMILIPIRSDITIAKTPQLIEAIISISMAGFVAAKSHLILEERV
ncbi:MAG: hypothetical protein M3261_02495 [Thermoproteota archaeon]|nr:hypothetical protein [Thermoproteota archaeon]